MGLTLKNCGTAADLCHTQKESLILFSHMFVYKHVAQISFPI